MAHKGLVLGKYEILDEVGRGGMGVVYRARDVRINRTVAIKELLINPSLAKAADEIIARFHREAQTAGGLSHPNVVTIHDFGADSGNHYIAMEFIEGKNLKEYMEEGHDFSDEELIDILIQICEGMQHAHERKVIHRDIKPDNISITAKGDVKITDFGIARMSTTNPMMSMTQDGTMLGTLGYISPEQLQDSRGVDHRADIFSLGAMMYELYTSKLPFDGGNLGATILKIVSEDPVPPTRVNADMDPRLEKIVMKALQKLPDFRYQNASEISEELRQIKRTMSGASGSGGANDTSEGMVPCPCDKKNMIFSGAKFCPYCGLNLGDAPVNTGPATPQMVVPKPPEPPRNELYNNREDALKRPMLRTNMAERNAAATKKPEKINSLKNRLNRLLELASTYQSNPRSGIDRHSFGRTQAVAPENNTQVLNPMRKTGHFAPSNTTIRSSTSDAPAGGGPPQPPAMPSMGARSAPSRPSDSRSTASADGDKASLQLEFSHKIGQVGAGKGQFYQPRGLAVYQGLIFVADTQNQRIQVFNKMGDWQYLIRAGSQQDSLKAPCSVTVSRQGQIYVVDSGTSRVAIFDQSGRFIRSFGSHGKNRGEFANPYGIAISSKDEVYVADTENGRIQVLDPNGQVMKIFGRPGTRPGEFKTPYAIALDSKDNLFILDYGIPRVQMMDRQGIARLDFGKRGVGGGEFSIPRGITVDIKGRVYVADTLNHRIQIFSPQGEFIESFGSKGRGPTDFWGPESIAVSDDGEVFVLDKGNSRVQVLKARNF